MKLTNLVSLGACFLLRVAINYEPLHGCVITLLERAQQRQKHDEIPFPPAGGTDWFCVQGVYQIWSLVTQIHS